MKAEPFWLSRGFLRLISPIAALAISGLVRFGWLLWRKFRVAESKDWPRVQAKIDITTGITRVVGSDSRENTYYVGVLTYFYQYPPDDSADLRTGEYERGGVASSDYGCFSSEKEAQTWADGYKGKMVTIRVNPKKPDDSVLADEDLP